jgi:hypothetical protein
VTVPVINDERNLQNSRTPRSRNRVRRSPVLNAHQQEIEFMRHRHQLALGLFAEDRPPPYPDTPSAIVVSVSGGLDSDYAALWARQRWPKHPLILWHAHLEAMDWPDTPAHLDMLAAALGNCRLISCQAVYELNGTTTPSGCNGTTLRRMQIVRDGVNEYGAATDTDPAAIRTLLDFARKARNGQPPTKKIRYCTDYFKIRLFNTWARAHRHMLGERSVLLSGSGALRSPSSQAIANGHAAGACSGRAPASTARSTRSPARCSPPALNRTSAISTRARPWRAYSMGIAMSGHAHA